MEAVLNELVSVEDLLKFEKKFQSEKAAGSVSKSTQFEYAWCLVRSKYNDDIRKGIVLLEELLPKGSKEEQRDYVFYLAVGNYRLKMDLWAWPLWEAWPSVWRDWPDSSDLLCPSPNPEGGVGARGERSRRAHPSSLSLPCSPPAPLSLSSVAFN
ncbi:mitochondrial fission 1 protein isoform X1 [Macaca fascicularis]|uniref:mitochondrial fission 1 protein isoform X1 n=1 Tax=Macaca fascicularis TaxID=9541 RepID=UPI0032B04D54